MDDVKIRDATTVILIRDRQDRAKVLMGQRGSAAAFMPNKFVFPGGAVDVDDTRVTLSKPISTLCAARLAESATASASTIIAAGIRELWEEAGLILGTREHWNSEIPTDWQTYAATGHVPTGENLHFIFRAITPPKRPRRFDARFLLADADHLIGDPDDFSAATDELSHLQWVPLDEVRRLDLPFITEVVLAEIIASLPDIGPPQTVPFFNNTQEQSLFERLGQKSPLDP